VIFLNERDLLAIGHTAIDYIIQIDEFPPPNSSVTIKKMKKMHGGAAANVAIVGSSLNLKTSLVSAVGGDFIGSGYHKKLKEFKIDTDSMIIIEDESTPTAFIMTNSKKDQISYFYWGAAKNFKNTEVPYQAIQKARAVHLATGDPSFNGKCGEIARKEDKLISFDPGQDLHLYTKKQLEKVIRLTDILFGNHFEIDRIQKRLSMNIKKLQEIGPHIIVKTYGKQGSIIYAEEKIKIGAVVCKATDPTGAGDSYRAGFLRAYLEGANLETCGKFASTVASFIVEAEGTQTNIPDYEMVKNRYENYWNEKLKLRG